MSPQVFEDLGAVERISGADRYDTAAAVAERLPARGQAALLATGEEWPDALTGAALAAHREAPVLLTRSTLLSDVTTESLQDARPGSVTVLGGTTAVTEGVVDTVRELTEGW